MRNLKTVFILMTAILISSLFLTCKKEQGSQIECPTDGLVAYYPFKGNANDESGNENNGNIYGATLTTDRFSNKNSAFEFNGLDNYIEVQSSNSLNVRHLSICAWVKHYSDQTMEIVNKYYYQGWGGEGTGYRLSSWWGNPNGYGFEIYDSNKQQHICNDIINPLLYNWTFVAVTYDGVNMKLFRNGALISTTNYSDSIPSNSDKLYIGNNARKNYWAQFKGKIDDIRIYNRALNDQEIQILFKEGK